MRLLPVAALFLHGVWAPDPTDGDEEAAGDGTAGGSLFPEFPSETQKETFGTTGGAWITWSTLETAPQPASSFNEVMRKNEDGTTGRTPQGCKWIFIEKANNTNMPGLADTTEAKMEPYPNDEDRSYTETFAQMEVRAVNYVPRPIGMKGVDVDLYIDQYRWIHLRDLTIISRVLRANAIRIEPWDEKEDHSNFLDRAKELGLYVIPTFDLRWYFEDEFARFLPFSVVRKEVVDGFDQYLRNVKHDDPILMWSINYALNLNETVAQGVMSGASTNTKRDRYFGLLGAIRHVHYLREFNASTTRPLAFLRPLALPLNLDSTGSAQEVSWYMAFVETQWGVWPQSFAEVENNITVYQWLRPLGSFDVWIAQMMNPTTIPGRSSAIAAMKFFNRTTKHSSDTNAEETTTEYNSYVEWRNPSTSTYRSGEEYGEVFEDCRRGGAGHCTYPTQKAVIFQFAFAALGQGKLLRLKEDINDQQRFMQDVWTQITGAGRADRSCVSSAIVDEWVDDWVRCATGVTGLSFKQQRGGICDETRPGQMIHAEWFGLNSQYTFFGMHCIDPRFNQGHPLAGRNLDGRPGNSTEASALMFTGFRFDKTPTYDYTAEEWFDEGLGDHAALVAFHMNDEEQWRQVSQCTFLLPSLRQYIGIGVCLLLVVLINVYRGMKLRQKRAEAEKEEAEEEEEMGTMQSDAPGTNMTEKKEDKAASGPPLVKWEHQIEIPSEVGGRLEWPKGCKQFTVEMRAEVKNEKGRGRFTQQHCKVHIQAHSRAQSRRLRHQLESEAMAVQAQRGSTAKLAECFAEAMVNMHARILEGYCVWIEHRVNRKAEDAKDETEWMETVIGGGAGRATWQLWIEALLMRLIESLGEQMLHSPEFCSAIFHEVRWATHMQQPDLAKKEQDALIFELDYTKLHVGIDLMKKQGNPFKGGVNFDDDNDNGVVNKIDKTDLEIKSFQESISLMVLVDILSNFQPVFVLKYWIFMVAWYVHLGNDRRNGSFGHPTYRRSNFIQQCMILDSIIMFFMEAACLLQGMWQKRCSWNKGLGLGRGRWMARRTINMGLAVVGLALSTVVQNTIDEIDWTRTLDDIEQVYTEPKSTALTMCMIFFSVRIVSLFVTTQAKPHPFLPGRPQSRKAREAPSEAPLTASAAILIPDANAQGNPLLEGDEPPPGRPRGSMWGTFAAPEARRERADARDGQLASESKMLSYIAWFTMLGFCFWLEIAMVAPLAADFDAHEFCAVNCNRRMVLGDNALLSQFGYVRGSDCYACLGTIFLVLSLVFLTAFFDIYFIFYLGTAIFGYGMGEMRGLRNVLASTLRHLDLDGGGGQISGKKNNHRARSQFTDGEAMKACYGSSWRMIWSRLVEALYEDCHLHNNEVDKMVAAAGTVRFTKRDEQSNDFAKPADRFKEVKFKSTAVRGGDGNGGSDRGRRRCISVLQIKQHQFKDPLNFLVSEDSTKDVCLQNEQQKEEVINAMDPSSLKVKEALGALEIQKDWQLMSGEDVQAFTNTDLWEQLKELSNFPAMVVFKKSLVKFEEVHVKLEEPCGIHAVSFLTGQDDVALDPIQFTVEGLLHQPGAEEGAKPVWKQLVWQSTPFLPPLRRNAPANSFFNCEFWRKRGAGAKSSVDLQSCLPIVHERLGFFVASLRGILAEEKFAIREGVDTLLDSHIGNIPMLSQVIPCYAETVMNDEKSLKEGDGLNTNLAFITSQFPEEWTMFCARQNMPEHEVYKIFVDGVLSELAIVKDGMSAEEAKRASDAKALIQEIRLWAAMRSQTVAKTIVGAMCYHDVLSMLPNVANSEDPYRVLAHTTELILAHQTYGTKKSGATQEAMDTDVRFMLARYKTRPFYLVLDYDSTNARPSMTRAVNRFVQDQYSFEGLRFASVKAQFRKNYDSPVIPPEDAIEIIEVIPRYYGLLVGTPGFMTQGKAGNQLGALRFAHGHFMQMMDANMGAFLGEAAKVPFVLRRFQPHWEDRRLVQSRIIGFREFIFTEHHGTVGGIMASAEWSFGTICQRFLAGLGARMHYGHPDFLDGFWASNRGGLSKASPAINLSEDIFAGFNVAMRGEKSTHVDFLAWEKGREASFNAASLFFSKVSGGNVGVMRSRDLKIICENLGIFDSFSFYFASVGFYLNNVIIDMSAMIYVTIFVLLTLSSKSLNDVGVLDSMLAAEWVMSLGIIAMVPRLLELVLEYGPLEGIMRFFPSVPGCMLMFTFINKSIAMAVVETITTGEAHYIATGRPNANTHYSWRQCYFLFVKTHFYPGLQIIMMYTIYQMLSQGFEVSSLPMVLVIFAAVMWIIAPIIFCPQPTLTTLSQDLAELWSFAIATPDGSIRTNKFERNKTTEASLRVALNDPRSTLYEFWLADALLHKKAGPIRRLLSLLFELLKLVLTLSVIYGSMLDHFWDFTMIIIANFFLWDLWRALNRPTAITLIVMLLWYTMPVFIFPDVPRVNIVTVLVVYIQLLSVLKHIILSLCWFWLSPNLDWTGLPEKDENDRKIKQMAFEKVLSYDMVVEYLYVNFLTHLLHMTAAIVIVVLFFCTQSVCVVLDMIWGIHSYLMLNNNLLSTGFCAHRKGYEPGGGKKVPESARYKYLSGKTEG